MAKFNTAQSFADGDTVTGAKLNNITSQLNIYTGVISEQTAMAATVSTADQLLIADTDNGDSGAANRVTVQKLLNDTLTNGTYTNAQLSGNLNVTQLSTLGTISSTRGTVGILNSTTGTIAGLNTTTGTITNLSATTSTFLGAITGSTNVVNIGSGQIYKTAAGSVGIGTTTPSGKLDVKGGYIYNTTTPTGFAGLLTNNGTGDGISISTDFSVPTSYLDFPTRLNLRDSDATYAVRLAITSAGNFGIGTTTPDSKLNIYGTGSTASNPSTSGTLGATLALTDSGGAAGNGGMAMFGVGAGYFSAIKGSLANGSTNTVGNLLFCVRNAIADATLTEAMRIDYLGNVGIGSTSPDAKLEIEGVGSTASNPSTTSSVDATIGIKSSTGAGNGGMLMLGSQQGYHAAIKSFLTNGASNTTGDLLFCTRTNATNTTLTEAMRIDASGNVGIATSAPVNKLEVVGSFGRGAPVTKTADFTLAATENWIIVNKAAATCTVTLPAASSWTGREFTIKTLQAFTVVSASANVVPRNSETPGTAILAAAAGNWATLVSNGTNWVIMCGS